MLVFWITWNYYPLLSLSLLSCLSVVTYYILTCMYFPSRSVWTFWMITRLRGPLRVSRALFKPPCCLSSRSFLHWSVCELISVWILSISLPSLLPLVSTCLNWHSRFLWIIQYWRGLRLLRYLNYFSSLMLDWLWSLMPLLRLFLPSIISFFADVFCHFFCHGFRLLICCTQMAISSTRLWLLMVWLLFLCAMFFVICFL